jgi:hypothetical protein
LAVDGGALLVVVDHRGWRELAAAPGQPTALCALGAQLAFATFGIDETSSIRVVHGSSGRLAVKLHSPVPISDMGFDARLNQLCVFSRCANVFCWLPADVGSKRTLSSDPCSRAGGGLAGRARAEAGPFTEYERHFCCCGREHAPTPHGHDRDHTRADGDPSGGPGDSGVSVVGGSTGTVGQVGCQSGGPGVVDGCYQYVVLDRRRLVRIDRCRPGSSPCAIALDHPVEQLTKAGSFLVAQGDGGHYLAQIDPTTMRIVHARAFPRGGALLAAHSDSDLVLLYERRQRCWHWLDLAAAARHAHGTSPTPSAGDFGSRFSGA